MLMINKDLLNGNHYFHCYCKGILPPEKKAKERERKARPQRTEATGEVHPTRAGPYTANMFPSHGYIYALQ